MIIVCFKYCTCRLRKLFITGHQTTQALQEISETSHNSESCSIDIHNISWPGSSGTLCWTFCLFCLLPLAGSFWWI